MTKREEAHQGLEARHVSFPWGLVQNRGRMDDPRTQRQVRPLNSCAFTWIRRLVMRAEQHTRRSLDEKHGVSLIFSRPAMSGAMTTATMVIGLIKILKTGTRGVFEGIAYGVSVEVPWVSARNIAA